MNKGPSSPGRDLCLDWIYTKKSEVECTGYGTNRKSVSDAIAEVGEKSRKVRSYETAVSAAEKDSPGQDAGHVQETYEGLKDTLEKKLGCLKTLLEVTGLEESCGILSAEFDSKAVHLVSSSREAQMAALASSDRIGGFNSPFSRDCVFATRDNWDWILTLVDCAKTHLTNAAEYHQFFHEIDESAPWLLEDLRRVALSFDVTKFKGDYEDAKRLVKELEDMGRILRQWDAKTQRLWERAGHVVPVHLRVEGIRVETPCRAIADYKSKEIDMRRGEDLLLLDNTRATLWVVRTARGQEAEVPAACVLIPGPDDSALEAASRLRLQLLTAWTNVLKRLGKRLLCFMLLVFKPVYEEDEICLLRTTRNIQKADLLRILDYIEASLVTHWSEHEAFIALQERVLALRMILEESNENEHNGEGVKMSLVVQVTMLEDLMKKYRELWAHWESMKVSVEASRSPELMLIVDKWEQLQYVSRAYMSKFWQTDLHFDDFERSLSSLQVMVSDEAGSLQGAAADGVDRVDGGDRDGLSYGYQESIQTTGEIEEVVQMSTASKLGRAHSTVEDSNFGMASEMRTAETEQLLSAEMEEKKTFFIRAVLDPRTDHEMSMDDAVIAGIINPGEGIYFNPVTLQRMPIPEAMSAGLIKVSFTTTKRSREKKSTFGLITVKTTRMLVQSYAIRGVKDLATGQVLTPKEAYKKGIIDETRGVFVNMKTRAEMLIAEAIEAGFITVDYQGTGSQHQPEVVTKTYAVRAVVDRRQKKTVTFQEALRRGIINKETGAFQDTLTGDSMYVGDAIMRGFLKARQVDDSEGLNIDPENRLVIDKTNVIRRKLLQPLGVISAFRRAAKMMPAGK